MTNALYSGPIIDAHIHLWDLSAGNYPWLMPSGNFGPKGRLDALKGKDYVLEDFRRDAGGAGVVASVHVEALWDAKDSPTKETIWLESLDKSHNEAIRYVAGAPFGRGDTEEVIKAQAAFARVKAIRQTIAWTPDPNRRMVDRANITEEPEWRAALPVLIRYGLALELLMYPWQAENVVNVASTYPDLLVIIDHIGSPIDQTGQGLDRWRAGITAMSALPNIVVKLSAAAAYPEAKTLEAVRPSIVHILESFGADRVMFGSDFPVGKLAGMTYPEYLDLYKAAVMHLSSSDQKAVFFDTACRIYGMGKLDS